MFSRFHEKRRNEEGFTLIELLVVVLIIAILAAIAVPVFLNQRKKAWISQVESSLKDAATAQESWRTDNTAYTSSVTDLETEGFNYSDDDVEIDDVNGDADGYCIEVSSDHDDNIVGEYSSADGAPKVVDDGSDPGASAPDGGALGGCTA